MFRKHISVTPFHEDDVQRLIDVVGVDAVTFGSDFRTPRVLPLRERVSGRPEHRGIRVCREDHANEPESLLERWEPSVLSQKFACIRTPLRAAGH